MIFFRLDLRLFFASCLFLVHASIILTKQYSNIGIFLEQSIFCIWELGISMLIIRHPGSFDQRSSGEKLSYYFYILIPSTKKIFHKTVGLSSAVPKVQGRRFAGD